ncbi:MAG TPA: hypothetical protein ENJ53_04770, partial [Phaeodactylibacter sp.]|nr:hypothetical protein [Phaeodactylibacter sp.]
MIVKGKTNFNYFLRTAIVLLCSIGGAFSLWYFLPQLSSWKEKGVIFCDAEVVRGKYFVSHGDLFFNAETQSNEAAFEGNFSSKIKTGKGFQYGFGLDFKSFESGKTYVASVWRKKAYHGGKSTLVIMDKNQILHWEVSEPVREKNDWELLEKKFTIPFRPNEQKIEDLKIYVRSDGKGVFYFDNLKVIEKKNLASSTLLPFESEVIELSISPKGIKKLEQKRKEALQVGVLESNDKDWVNATLTSSKDEEIRSVELRLKGDWLDHLKNNKWSFRVKVKDPSAWRRMKVFSLQSPKTREFLNEWVLHQWWKIEDVLTPRYDFVELKLNGKSLGVYAYEEHFAKQLPESNQRREGVIVRFSETGFWADVKKRLGDMEGNPIAHVNNSANYRSAEVRPFKEKQVLKNPVLVQQLETAQNLLVDYIQRNRPPHEIFDTEKMAKYFAICDLLHAQHSVAWHNMRFYFNPVLNKLEPIGFDGFPTYKYPFLLMSEGALSSHFKENEAPIQYFFSDTTFLKQYIYNLFYFSEKEYVDSLLEKLDGGMTERFDFLTKEFQNYTSPKEAIKLKISGIRSGILPFNNLSLKAFLEKKQGDENIIRVGNTHSLPIEVIGTGFQKETISDYLEKPILLPAYTTSPFYKDQSKKTKKKVPNITNIIRHQIEYQDLIISNNSKYVFYKVLGYDAIFYSKIINWKTPQASKVAPLASKDIAITSNELFSVVDKKIIFHAGKYAVTKDIIIPKDYVVYFAEGTEIDFTKGAKFLSYSPVKMNGQADRPVKIMSSDHSVNGFTILQAEETSEMTYVIFENMNTHRKEDWHLTGGVTIYESSVLIEDCIFLKNHCEDALNIIRSDFE